MTLKGSGKKTDKSLNLNHTQEGFEHFEEKLDKVLAAARRQRCFTFSTSADSRGPLADSSLPSKLQRALKQSSMLTPLLNFILCKTLYSALLFPVKLFPSWTLMENTSVDKPQCLFECCSFALFFWGELAVAVESDFHPHMLTRTLWEAS